MKKLLFLTFFSLTIMACSTKEINDENSVGAAKYNSSQIENELSLNPDAQSNQDARYPPSTSFSVESDFVSVDGNGCFTINIRVYVDSATTGKLLILSQNVVACSDGDENMDRGSNSNDNDYICLGGELLNGDIVLPSKLEFKHCLAEFLNNPEHEEVYKQYLVKKRELLNSL